LDQAVGSQWPSVKMCKNWRRGPRGSHCPRSRERNQKNADEKPNEEILIYLCLTQWLVVFSPLIGHFWPINGIFGIFFYGNRGVSLVGWSIQGDYRPLVVSLIYGENLSLPDFMVSPKRERYQVLLRG